MVTLGRHGTTLIIELAGRLDGRTTPAAEADIVRHLEAERQVVLDLGRLDYIASTGLRLILLVAKRLKQADGRLALCELQPNVREVFEISGFASILTVCGDRGAALAAVA